MDRIDLDKMEGQDDEEERFDPEQSVTGKLLRGLHAMHKEMVQGISAASSDDRDAVTIIDEGPEVYGHFAKDSLTLSHSLGYDCTRRNNLHVLGNHLDNTDNIKCCKNKNTIFYRYFLHRLDK